MHTFGTPEQWTAGGTWALAAVTLLLVVGAFWAGYLALQQMRLSHNLLVEAERSRKASVRPCVVGVELRRRDGLVVIRAANIGTGPAFEVCGVGQYTRTPKRAADMDQTELEALGSQLEARGGEPPDWSRVWPALAAGDFVEDVFTVPGRGDGIHLRVGFQYKDVFGRVVRDEDEYELPILLLHTD